MWYNNVIHEVSIIECFDYLQIKQKILKCRFYFFKHLFVFQNNVKKQIYETVNFIICLGLKRKSGPSFFFIFNWRKDMTKHRKNFFIMLNGLFFYSYCNVKFSFDYAMMAYVNQLKFNI